MKVTFETNGEDAKVILHAQSYIDFIEEFWTWANGPGRESSPDDYRAQYRKLGVIHEIYFHD